MLYIILIIYAIFFQQTNCEKAEKEIKDYGFLVVSMTFISVLIFILLGCLDFKKWISLKKSKFNVNIQSVESCENFHQSFPTSYNPDATVTFDSLPEVEVAIPGSSQDLLEKYFFPKIYTEKNLVHIEVEKEVENLMKLLKNKHHIERLNITRGKEIGRSWFGAVMSGTLKEKNKTNKCIISSLDELAAPSQVINYFKETAAFREIKHENVLKLMYTNIDTIPFWTVLEFCHLDDLKSYLMIHSIAKESVIQKGLIIRFACDAASGLNALHDHKYTHRDLAARNCLITSNLTVKIGDYGLSQQKFKEDYLELEGFMIPLRWLAPESYHIDDSTFKFRKVSKIANIWTFGILIWELISFGMRPYQNLSDVEVISVAKDKNLKSQFSGDELNSFGKSSEKLIQIMNSCLTAASKRPTLTFLISQLSMLKSDFSTISRQHKPVRWQQMKETLSNCGSPCEFISVEDAFMAESVINENFNFESIALSIEPASDDLDFDDIAVSRKAVSTSDLRTKEFDPKNCPEDSKEDMLKASSLDHGLLFRSLDTASATSSFKFYHDSLTNKHTRQNILFENPFKNQELDKLNTKGDLCIQNISFTEMPEVKIFDENDAEIAKITQNKTDLTSDDDFTSSHRRIITVSPCDIHYFDGEADDGNNDNVSYNSSDLSLVSNTASKIVNVDKNSITNRDILLPTLDYVNNCFSFESDNDEISIDLIQNKSTSDDTDSTKKNIITSKNYESLLLGDAELNTKIEEKFISNFDQYTNFHTIMKENYTDSCDTEHDNKLHYHDTQQDNTPRYHDTQQDNKLHYHDTQQDNKLHYHDTQQDITHHLDTQHNDTHHLDTQHNDTHHLDTQHHDTQTLDTQPNFSIFDNEFADSWNKMEDPFLLQLNSNKEAADDIFNFFPPPDPKAD